MTTLNSALLKEIEGLDFYKEFFVAGIYEDGRETDAERPYLVRVGLDQNAAGSSYVQHNGCTLSCTVIPKAGYYDPLQCIRFRFEKSNAVPKKEFDFCRAILTEFARKHIFVDPKSLTFDAEYQIQLILTITINTCDGFLLGPVFLAVQAAINNTKIPKTSVDSTDIEDLEAKFKQGAVVKERSRFVFDTENLIQVQLRNRLVYTGLSMFKDQDDDEPILLVDPPSHCIDLIEPRFDVILSETGNIFLWQAGITSDLTKDLRKSVYEKAMENTKKVLGILETVQKEGRVQSEDME
ncbi:unnamed protein product [Bursaphelenchus xylophilus]|uniref:(pine wood nematode) hypothetical protein n=1 Tax=Bursaphelenchus xylophilus TaxID=6326 RepID=A0A1I7S2J2_BURXY|nr:unnamed protein product [Bursaphelenchus xylophilus]CAG9121913.1 unnamed protein product [Bursaphelenchus xylophilus]